MYQTGFTPGDSTSNQLVSIYHDVCTALDDHKDIQLIFLISPRHLMKCSTKVFCLFETTLTPYQDPKVDSRAVTLG